ncbi:hypothetical protein BH09BAC6_BH09BAC6_20110 [soil metagenome]|jgi:4-amino-4-deoxy-L-arabinose transferase-like glycosyltransferase
MKRLYILMFVGIAAILLLIVTLINYDPNVQTWSSLLLGAAMGYLVVKSPVIVSLFKNKRKAAK